MDRPEMLSLLRSGHDEIVTLRRINAELAPKAHAYDTLAAVVRLSPEPSQSFGVDTAWRLKQAVEKLEAERVAEHDEAESA